MNTLFLTVFVFKYLIAAIGNVLFHVHIQYLPVICFLYLAYNFGKKVVINQQQYIVLLLVILFYIQIVAHVNIDTIYSEKKSMQMTFQGFFYLFFPFLALYIKEHLPKVMVSKIISSFLLLFLFLLSYKLFLFNEIFSFEKSFVELSVNFHNYFSLFKDTEWIMVNDELETESIFTGRLIGIFLLYLVLFTRLHFSIKIGLSIFLIVVMLLVGNRGSMLAVALTLFVISNRKIYITVFVLLLLTAFAFLIGFNDSLQESMGRSVSFESSGRLEIWMNTWNGVSTLFGNGIGAPIYGEFGYPHNMGIEIFFELGFIAFIIYTGSIIFLMTLVNRYRFFLLEKKILYSSSLYYLIASQFSGDMFMNINSFSLILTFLILHFSSVSNGFNMARRSY
jgi:hypothetical protein